MALDLVEAKIDKNRENTNLAISLYLDAEKGGVNTNHPGFEMISKDHPEVKELEEQDRKAKEEVRIQVQ